MPRWSSLAVRHETRAAETETAIFAGGCFWCVEDAFDEVDGVTETISGYAGGTKPNPNYGDHEGYLEAVKVTYDPAKVTYAKLLDHFWHNIDPFDPDGQFCDKGSAYRSVVFVANDAEKKLAETTKEEIADALQAKGRDRRSSRRPPSPRRRTTTRIITTPESGELQVLQMGLRPRAAARRDLGQAELRAFISPHRRGRGGFWEDLGYEWNAGI